MGRIVYDVPHISQEQNPICWVCCMAMVTSHRQNRSASVGEFAGGFEPGSASIPNIANNLEHFYALLNHYGFTSVAGNATTDELGQLLINCGPLILTHQCFGFPYGPVPSTMVGVHAVVITGLDTAINGGQAWFNNPWPTNAGGGKDKPALATQVNAAITTEQTVKDPATGAPIRCIAYLRR